MKDPNYYASKRDDVVGIVPGGVKKVLEVGCGMGFTGRAIKEREKSGVEVTGIEIVPEMAEKARANLDNVISGDVEKVELPFGKEYFDCILYGDVLEHLINPWKLLRQHCEFLQKGGYVIMSIPNIAHYRTIQMLCRKEWKYADAGILDSTHLRFFTLKSIKRMVSDAGLEIINMNRKISASKSKKFFNRISGGALIDYMTEQYIILARK